MSAPVIAVVGPTAAGKSAAAIDLARASDRDVEIVAADAFTIYRGMDIATAKPDAAVRDEVPHHLIDVLDPSEDATVAWFQQRARGVIDEVHARGAVPVLVGGSGLYFRAVVDDLRFPPTDPDVRDAIEERYAGDPAAAHAYLERLDPAAAAKIEPENLRRSVRALEVIELTGERFSSFADAWDEHRSIYPDLQVWGVDLPTEELKARITDRVEAMLDAGLVDEARRLAAGDLSRTARQAIGYAEAWAYLRGEIPDEQLGEEIARRTWRYARRQRGWFRRDPRIRWVEAGSTIRPTH